MRYAAMVGIVALGTVWTVHADDAVIKKAAKATCSEISTATLKGDFAKIVDLTHPKLIEKMGGKEKAAQAMATGFDNIKAKGVTLKNIDVGEPSEIVKAKDELYLYVPLNIEMTSAAGKLRQKSFVVGVSADMGKTWLFLNGEFDSAAVKELLPNLPEALKLPARQLPLIEK